MNCYLDAELPDLLCIHMFRSFQKANTDKEMGELFRNMMKGCRFSRLEVGNVYVAILMTDIWLYDSRLDRFRNRSIPWIIEAFLIREYQSIQDSIIHTSSFWNFISGNLHSSSLATKPSETGIYRHIYQSLGRPIDLGQACFGTFTSCCVIVTHPHPDILDLDQIISNLSVGTLD